MFRVIKMECDLISIKISYVCQLGVYCFVVVFVHNQLPLVEEVAANGFVIVCCDIVRMEGQRRI